jgi:hypothetical protein
MRALQLPDAPSVTPCFARRATSPVSLRYTGQEEDNFGSLLPREAGEVALVAKRRVTEGAFVRHPTP